MVRFSLVPALLTCTVAPPGRFFLEGVQAQEAGCVCESWDHGTPGLRWSGGASPGPTAATSADECQKKCCDANQSGSCVAYSYNEHAAQKQACTIWTTAPQQQATVEGWTSGTLSSPAQCGLFAGSMGWVVVAFIGGGIPLYFICGMALKSLNAHRDLQTQDVPEWLPHQQVWYGLAGLVVDGVMCCTHCGQLNAPPGIAKPNPDLGVAFITSDEQLQRNSWATPPGSPNPAGYPVGGRASTGSMSSSMSPAGARLDDHAFAGQTSLHHVCKIAEIGKLSKLLRALKAVGADLRAMDAVDGRGFSPFHVACAGGHAQVVEALCHAGCNPSLRNEDGYTGWQLAESLDRAEILALNREELNVTAERARARRNRELEGQKSPVVTLKTTGSGLLQHESY